MRLRYPLISSLVVLAFFCFTYSETKAVAPNPNVSENDSAIKELRGQIEELKKQIASLQEELRTSRKEQDKTKQELEEVKAEFKLTKSLYRGSKGEDVRHIQEFLSKFPEIYPEKLITGFFGALTEQAVKKFQEKHGIENVGIFGPKTLAKANELIAETPELVPTAGSERATSLLLVTSGTPNQKITVCHLPPGNISNQQTIEIGPSALATHLAHGDSEGACLFATATTTPQIPAPTPTPTPSPTPVPTQPIATCAIQTTISTSSGSSPLYGSSINLSGVADLFSRIWCPQSNGISLGFSMNTTTKPGIGWGQQINGKNVTSFSIIKNPSSYYLAETGTVSVTVTGPSGSVIEIWDLETLKVIATNVSDSGSTVNFTAQSNRRYGGFAWYTDNSQKDLVISISAPSSAKSLQAPTPVKSSLLMSVAGAVSDLSLLPYPRDIEVRGNYAYVLTSSTKFLAVVDISDQSAPIVVSSMGDPRLANATSLVLNGDYAYITDHKLSAVAVINISNPLSPRIVGYVSDARLNGAWSAALSGNYLYIGVFRASAMTVVDVSNPTSPKIVGSLGGLFGAQGIAISGNYAYVVALNANSINVIDISNPLTPVLVGSLVNSFLLYQNSSVSVSGNYAYVVSYAADRFTIVDISNPRSPKITGSLQSSSIMDGSHSVTVYENYAFITAAFARRLVIVDISTPDSPFIADSLYDENWLWNNQALSLSGNYVYVTAPVNNGMVVIDISKIIVPTTTPPQTPTPTPTPTPVPATLPQTTNWTNKELIQGGGTPSLAWNGRNYAAAWGQSGSLFTNLFTSTSTALGAPFAVASGFRTMFASDIVTGSQISGTSHARYGISWVADPGGGQLAYFAHVDSDGTKLVHLPISSADNNAMGVRPALVWTGSNYAAAWAGLSGGAGRIYFTKLAQVKDDPSSFIIDSRMAIPSATVWGDNQVLDMAWNGSVYGVVWLDTKDSGDLNKRSVYFSTLHADGYQLTSAIKISGKGFTTNSPNIIADGENFIVVWEESGESNPNADSHIHFSKLNKSGTVLVANKKITQAPSTTYGGYNLRLHLAKSGSYYGIAWTFFEQIGSPPTSFESGPGKIYFKAVDSSGNANWGEELVSWIDGDNDYPYLAWSQGKPAIVWRNNSKNSIWLGLKDVATPVPVLAPAPTPTPPPTTSQTATATSTTAAPTTTTIPILTTTTTSTSSSTSTSTTTTSTTATTTTTTPTPTPVPPAPKSPIISNIQTVNTTSTSTQITWTTEATSNSQVSYSTQDTSILQYWVGDSNRCDAGGFVTSHCINLTSLSPNTTYYFTVTSLMQNGEWTESAHYQFVTTATPPPPPPPPPPLPPSSNSGAVRIESGYVYLKVSNSAGAVLNDIKVSDYSSAFRPAVVGTVNGFSVFWEEHRVANQSYMQFATFDSSGNRLTSNKTLFIATGNNYVDAVWNGSGYGMSWHSPEQTLYFALLDANGNKTSSDVLVYGKVIGDNYEKRLSWTGSEYGITWGSSDDREVYFALISAGGVKQSSVSLSSCGDDWCGFPTTSWNGSKHNVIWKNVSKGLYYSSIIDTSSVVESTISSNSSAVIKNNQASSPPASSISSSTDIRTANLASVIESLKTIRDLLQKLYISRSYGSQ